MQSRYDVLSLDFGGAFNSALLFDTRLPKQYLIGSTGAISEVADPSTNEGPRLSAIRCDGW